MLARLLQFITLLVLGFSVAWWVYFWTRSPTVAIVGALGSLLFYAPVLAIQFFAVMRVHGNDPAPAATWQQLLKAWWAEVLEMPVLFCWRLPFFWNDLPDDVEDAFSHRGRRGVVFIHGFVCNRGIWTPWLSRLHSARRAYVAVNLEPVFGSIDDYVPLIEQAVQRVTQATGMAPLVVCHSMGGLAIRAWLRAAEGGDARLHHVVTIGTPHHGTWLGQFALQQNARQMRLGNPWLTQLQAAEPAKRHALFTCYYSNCDNIVFPATSATLSGADNRFAPGLPHVAMAFDQTVMSESLAKL